MGRGFQVEEEPRQRSWGRKGFGVGKARPEGAGARRAVLWIRGEEGEPHRRRTWWPSQGLGGESAGSDVCLS